MIFSTLWQRLRWYHGIVFYIVINLMSGARLATREYLDTVGRPPFMPPDWAFAPIWITLQVFMIIAGFQLLKKMKEETEYPSLFWTYATTWAFFTMFSWFYFGLHSPILGFATTFGMFLVNAANLYLGFRAQNRSFAWLMTPLMVWLSLATAVAGWQMLFTPDEFFNLPSLLAQGL